MGMRVFQEEPFWTLDDIRLQCLLTSVGRGDIQRPMFCRPWSWSGDDVVDLIATVIQGGPIDIITLAQPDSSTSLTSSALPGTGELARANRCLSHLVVDGQQRLVALFGALLSSRPMRMPVEDGRVSHRLHYLDMRKVFDDVMPVRDAILPVSVLADSSPASPDSPDLRDLAEQSTRLLFPVNRMFDFCSWERDLMADWKARGRLTGQEREVESVCSAFRQQVVKTFERYQVPVQAFGGDLTPDQLARIYVRSNPRRTPPARVDYLAA